MLRKAMKKKSHGEMRIVSLAPSATAILCAVGARATLVGVTKWCADVARVDGLPRVGDCWHMGSPEEILRLRPTLVIGSVPFKADTVAKLLEHPVNFLAMNPRTLADVYGHVHMLARIVGRAAAGERLVARMRREFAAIAARAINLPRRVRVYCEAWPNPRISSPPWVVELVELCGGEMVVPSGARVSDAEVAAAAPEAMVLAWAATGAKAQARQAYGVAAWQEVPAIRERRVFVVRDELLNTPGPPLIAGAKKLWRIVRGIAGAGKV
ncbi:MAG: ABC transporter substrate-binding protein [Candidatus Acidiferrum sp.]|jgi:iron complex transport system substrate-binding protein